MHPQECNLCCGDGCLAGTVSSVLQSELSAVLAIKLYQATLSWLVLILGAVTYYGLFGMGGRSFLAGLFVRVLCRDGFPPQRHEADFELRVMSCLPSRCGSQRSSSFFVCSGGTSCTARRMTCGWTSSASRQTAWLRHLHTSLWPGIHQTRAKLKESGVNALPESWIAMAQGFLCTSPCLPLGNRGHL